MALEPLTLFGPWQYTGFPALSTHFLSGLGPESLDGEGSPTASAQSMAAHGTSCRKRKVESGQQGVPPSAFTFPPPLALCTRGVASVYVRQNTHEKTYLHEALIPNRYERLNWWGAP